MTDIDIESLFDDESGGSDDLITAILWLRSEETDEKDWFDKYLAEFGNKMEVKNINDGKKKLKLFNIPDATIIKLGNSGHKR